MTSATLGNGSNGVYTEAMTYDALARATDTKLTRTSDGTTLYEQTRAYDAVGNVANLNTTLPTGSGTGTDNQAFCYDERNRLTWAGSVGTVPCTGVPVTAGTLTSAQYSQAYSYDTLDRLTSGPMGAYSYGDSAHLHAVTTIGSPATYTATYDAAGNMTCRAPSSATTCSGTQTGAILTWDNEGRLSGWQNAPSNPTSTTTNLYDGAGNRVEQQITSPTGNSSITYVGTVEEVTTSSSGTSTTTEYTAGGKSIAEGVNGVFSFLASDGLGSALVALDGSSGNPTASVLYDPYGRVRYTNGAMPGSRGFTNQHADSTTGLDDYGARYYDAVAGAFISADTQSDGLNEYAYVHGNPETLTDPSGHRECYNDCGTTETPPAPSTNPPPTTPPGTDPGSTGPGDCHGGGKACTTTPGLPQNTCDAACQHKRVLAAQNDALKVAAELNQAAAWFTAITVVVTAIAAAAAASVFNLWIAATIIASGILTAVAVISVELLILSSDFSAEVPDHPDDAWWTLGNVSSFGQDEQQKVVLLNLALFELGKAIAEIPVVGPAIAQAVGAGMSAGAAISMLVLPGLIDSVVSDQEGHLDGSIS